MFELKFAAEVSDLTGTWAVGVLDITQVLHFQHWLKNEARAFSSQRQLFPKPLSSPCLKTMA